MAQGQGPEGDTRHGGQGLFFYRAGCPLDMHATTGSIAFHNASSGSVQPACFFCQNLSDRTASPLPMFAMRLVVTLRVCDKIPVICLVDSATPLAS